MPFPVDLPPHDQLADEFDELGWDRALHGRMRDFAEDETTIEVEIHTDHKVKVED